MRGTGASAPDFPSRTVAETQPFSLESPFTAEGRNLFFWGEDGADTGGGSKALRIWGRNTDRGRAPGVTVPPQSASYTEGSFASPKPLSATGPTLGVGSPPRFEVLLPSFGVLSRLWGALLVLGILIVFWVS